MKIKCCLILSLLLILNTNLTIAIETNEIENAASRLRINCPENTEEAINCFKSKEGDALKCMDGLELNQDRNILLSLGKCLGEIRSKLIPNFKDRPMSENFVRVILNGQPVYNPQKSTDPEVRKAYDKAFAEWQLHNQIVELQGLLKMLNVEITGYFLKACSFFPSKSSADIEFLKQVATMARLTEDESRAIKKLP